MSNYTYSTIILAAGQGTRMKSPLPKVMHKIAEVPMIEYVINTAKKLNLSEFTVVSRSDAIILNDFLEENQVNTSYQNQQLGTAHAVKCGLKNLNLESDATLILYGDTPLISEETILKASEVLFADEKNAVVVFAFEYLESNQYGRLECQKDNVIKIIEFRDLEDKQIDKLTICNAGIMLVRSNIIKKCIEKVEPNNSKGEYYLTDIVEIANNEGFTSKYILGEFEEFLGVNSQKELANVNKIVQERIKNRFLDSGVSIIDPQNTYISYDANIEPNVTIYPFNFIGKNSVIRSGSIINSFSHIEGAYIGENSIVGPFARIRPGTKLTEEVHVGSFVETKKAKLNKGAKANHLAYLGDIEIGEKTNIGAGTIICNYDGFNKHKSVIGNDVFVGSNSTIISPVEIANGSFIAAGSVVSKNVEEEALVVTRAEEKHYAGKARIIKKRKSEEVKR